MILPSGHDSCFCLDTESRKLFVLSGQTVVYTSLLKFLLMVYVLGGFFSSLCHTVIKKSKRNH